MIEHIEVWLIVAVTVVGYAFFLGHWAGRREAKRQRALMYRFIRAGRMAAKENPNGTFTVQFGRAFGNRRDGGNGND